jgi:SnoaL-like domain
MTTEQIAGRLKALLQQGQFEAAQKELFAPDATSAEPAHTGQPSVSGLDAIVEKGAQFRNMVEAFHSLSASEVISSNNHIAIALKVELTFKGQERTTMDEIIVYEVKDGKIVYEQFYY